MTRPPTKFRHLRPALLNKPLNRYHPEVLLIRIAVMQVVFYSPSGPLLPNDPVDHLLKTTWVRADREFYPDLALRITEAGRKQAFATLPPSDIKEAERLAEQWRRVEAERLADYRRSHS